MEKILKDNIETKLYYEGDKLIEIISAITGINENNIDTVGAGGKSDVSIFYDIKNDDSINKFLPDNKKPVDVEIAAEGNLINEHNIVFELYITFYYDENDNVTIKIKNSKFTYNVSTEKYHLLLKG